MILSIGVPVYNAEETIDKCIESIVSSDGFCDYELICIDDGSTDNSKVLLKKWASKYENIRIISTDNQGAFLARKRIINEAKGKWIGFVDSDDIIKPNMYDEMLNVSYNYKLVDMIVCAYSKDGSTHMKDFHNSYIALSYLNNNYGRMLAVNPAYWNKIYRREIVIKSLNLSYSPKIMEDALFFCSILPQVRGVAFLDKPLYCYNNSDYGVTRKIGLKEVYEAERGINDLINKTKALYDSEIGIKNYIEAYFTLHLGVAFSVNSTDKSYSSIKKTWLETRRFLDKYLPGWKRNKYLSIRYVSNNREILKLYLGYVLYKRRLWPVIVKIYTMFCSLIRKDLKW